MAGDITANTIYDHNTGARQKMAVHDVMLFMIFDWTMASIVAFDWLWKNLRHASNPRHASNLLQSCGVCCK